MSYINPYQSSGQPPAYGQYGQYAGPPVDPTKINAPAIGLVAVGAVDLLQSVYALGRNLLGMNANRPAPPNVQNNPELLDFMNPRGPITSSPTSAWDSWRCCARSSSSWPAS